MNSNYSRGRPFGPSGCQVPIGKGVCGEQRTLDIINQFKMLYQKKMDEIDTAGGGDCLMEKLRLQQEWIGDLTEQNEMLVKAVEELEHEATERVEILEEKLQRSAQCLCEEEQKNKDCERTIRELKQKMEYLNSFGDIPGLANELKCKGNECESLKQKCHCLIAEMQVQKTKMEDLQEHNTSLECKLKDDTLLIEDLEKRFEVFKREREELRRKCKIAEKQCRCFEEENKKLANICEELKIKISIFIQDNDEYAAHKRMIESELKCTQQNLIEVKNTAEKCTCKIDDLEAENKKVTDELVRLNEENRSLMNTIDCQKNKIVGTTKLTQDEIVKLNATVNELQTKLQETKRVREEEERSTQEKMNSLNATIDELHKKLHEAIEMREKEMKEHQPTIAKLNRTIDELNNKLKQIEDKSKVCKICKGRAKVGFAETVEVQTNIEEYNDGKLEKQMELLLQRDEIIKIQTDTLNVLQNELDSAKQQIIEKEKYCNDVKCLKSRIAELENELKDSDFKIANLQTATDHKQCKYQVKKLARQRKCYEEVISYFKQEMTIMSDQLVNLQDLLTLSHSSIQEENNKLHEAFLNVQTINEQLSYQLTAAEQKILLENQMNQLNEAKISELEKLINEKEIDLGRHDRAIFSIKQSLQCSLKQNEDLHATIVMLNGTIVQLQTAIKNYELDINKSKESNINCQNQIECCKQKLEVLKCELQKKCAELCNLETAYNNQNRTLKSAQMELQEMRNRQKEKQCHLKGIITEWEGKYKDVEDRYNKLFEEYHKLEERLTDLTKKEAKKDAEIQRYRIIITDLKTMMIELNKELTKRQYTSKCESPECKKYAENLDKTKHQDMYTSCPCESEFYKSIVDSLKTSVVDLRKKLADSQKKNKDLEEKCKCTEIRYQELSNSQQEKDREYKELHDKLTEKLMQTQFEESRYVELSTQFEKELNNLRQELEIRNKQLNDVKRSAQEINSSRCIQLACAQDEVNQLKEELNELLRKQCGLNVENERLHQQSANMQCTINGLEEKSTLLKGQLEKYLSELQNVQSEKECIIQKNCELLNELRSLQRTANKQQRDLQLQCQGGSKIQRRPIGVPCMRTAVASPPPTCQSPWSLGSQGTASLHDDSPSRSPCFNEDCDWYSSNFKNYSEDEDDEEEDWVSKVENLAAQVRKTNKMWKSKLGDAECKEYIVTKDTKK